MTENSLSKIILIYIIITKATTSTISLGILKSNYFLNKNSSILFKS